MGTITVGMAVSGNHIVTDKYDHGRRALAADVDGANSKRFDIRSAFSTKHHMVETIPNRLTGRTRPTAVAATVAGILLPLPLAAGRAGRFSSLA